MLGELLKEASLPRKRADLLFVRPCDEERGLSVDKEIGFGSGGGTMLGEAGFTEREEERKW